MLRWEVHYEVQYEVHYKVQFEHRCFSWRPHTIKMYWKDSKSHNFRFTSLAIQKVHWQFLTRRAFGELIKRLCFQKELAHIQLSRHFFLGLNPRKWFRWNVPLFSIPINSSPRNFSPGKPVPLTQKPPPNLIIIQLLNVNLFLLLTSIAICKFTFGEMRLFFANFLF